MSLRGEINKISGDVRRSINAMALGELYGKDGTIPGTKKILGYVCAIHEDGELAGTIDVQEFNYDPGEYDYKGAGHHKGVWLSAIQENKAGYLIVPMLYSEVVIERNPSDGREYVKMYSHAKRIQMLTSSLDGENDGEVQIGVTEVKKFVETDEGLESDYDELEETKNKTSTIYTATSVIDQITSPDDEEGFKQEKTVEHKVITVGDTKITINGTSIQIKTSGKLDCKIGGTSITEEDGKVNIKTDNCSIDAKDVKVKGSKVTITGGQLVTQGASNTDLNGPFNAIKACPFSGAPHCGSTVAGT